MPWINIDYDNTKVRDEEILRLSTGIQKIVAEETKINDVFVYANNSNIKIKVAPIEILVRISKQKIKDEEKLFNSIKTALVEWKKANSFQHPINLTLQPMDWKFETGI